MGRYGSFWFIMAHFSSFRVLVQPIYEDLKKVFKYVFWLMHALRFFGKKKPFVV